MDMTLTASSCDRLLDVEVFMEIWPLLSQKALLQELEAASGKRISVFVFEGGGQRIEALLDIAAQRVGLDTGGGVRWAQWIPEGAGARIKLEDGSGEYTLSGVAEGSTLRRQ